MEAPSTTSSTDIRNAILETCTKHMSEGDMLRVAEYLKKNGPKKVQNPQYLFDVVLWTFKKHELRRHSLYVVRNEHEDDEDDEEKEDDEDEEEKEEVYIKIKSCGVDYPEMEIEIKETHLQNYMFLLLSQNMFEHIMIKREIGEKFLICNLYSEYREHLSDDQNHYGDFVYYCCDLINRSFAFWGSKPSIHRNYRRL
jgi:hypothetical protein